MIDFLTNNWKTIAGIIGAIITYIIGSKKRKADLFDRMQTAYDKFEKTMNNKFELMQKEINTLQNQNYEQAKKIHTLEQHKKTQQKKIQALEKHNKTLTLKIEQYARENENLHRENQNLKKSKTTKKT